MILNGWGRINFSESKIKILKYSFMLLYWRVINKLLVLNLLNTWLLQYTFNWNCSREKNSRKANHANIDNWVLHA